MGKRKSQGLGELIKTIVYAVAIAIAIRTFAYEPFRIPSGSMIPTLLVGDYLFVSKFSYGYSRFSLPLSPPIFAGRVLSKAPERGDVVVFKLPSDNDTDYIKRIVGLPGDEIQVLKGVLHINGTPIKREAAGEYAVVDASGHNHHYARFTETLPNGRKHYIIEKSDREDVDNTGIYRVPEGHYFAMGDNRDNSRDSRFLDTVGFIPRDNLVGRAEFIFFSVEGNPWRIWDWFQTLRVDRMFEAIR